jgi:hypothetical protein
VEVALAASVGRALRFVPDLTGDLADSLPADAEHVGDVGVG